jgi:hypothetical protein
MEVSRFPDYLLALGSLSLLSIADLRDRSLPGVRIFFWASVCFGLARDPAGNALMIVAVLLVVRWGSRLAVPALLILPPIFLPATWPVLLASGGVRCGLVSQGDMLALGGITCLLPWQYSCFALLGVALWKKFPSNRSDNSIAALPGMFSGVTVVFVLRHLLL